ncbi:MAG: homoserine O-acetyltransferase [Spirochaetia bacterium]|nr:homoserine O-acetyltransferase [Spirochaetia bacterium]
MEKQPADSVGIVKTQYFTFAEAPNEFILERGGRLGPVTLAYETYGTLNKDKSNAILVCHALTGSAHAAGYFTDDDIKGPKKNTGWWDLMIGPGKAMDTNKYFIICVNVIGSCYGSTGPNSINPATGKLYGMSFPEVTIPDMVKTQKILLDYLGINRLVTVIGGSMGGMQALEWALQFPDIPKSVIIIAASAALSAQEIALDAVGRNAIKMDAEWKDGNYAPGTKLKGLAVARMVGHISYLSEEGMEKKFGRRLEDPAFASRVGEFEKSFDNYFAVEGYLAHQGKKFVDRFDANSYMYITKAMDYFDVDLKYGGGSLTKAMKRVKAEVLMVSFSSDWLFSPETAKEMVQALTLNNKDVSYIEIESIHGHDAFLLEKKTVAENKILGQAFKNFLANIK